MFTQKIENREIYSVFQPIFSFSNQACVGAEALVRGKDLSTGEPLSAFECLEQPSSWTDVAFTKALNQMHLKNWQAKRDDSSWVFLNLDFDALDSLDDLCLQDVVQDLDLKGKELVVEVVENEIKDEQLFDDLIVHLRKMGCLIALDDFGAGHSNIDRIWKAEPDIVKLDRQVLLAATKSLRGESILRNLCFLIKQAGSITLLEGIETKEQAMLAMDVGVDLVQGFYFAKPNDDMESAQQGEELISRVISSYPKYREEKLFVEKIQRKGYATLFDRLDGIESAYELEQQMQQMAELSFIKRFFILDDQGYQISDEHFIDGESQNSQRVLKKGKGLCWKNRRYFIKAKQKTDRIYVSRPYRSLIDVELCLTISKAIRLNSGEQVVACYDVFYHDKSTSSIQISI